MLEPSTAAALDELHGWRDALGPGADLAGDALAQVARLRAAATVVYPPPDRHFAAFEACSYEDTRVVLLGQDPYHGPGQAMGLAFAVPRGIPLPPSLKNIYRELEACIPGWENPGHGDLTAWAQQGVLLLNTALSVQDGRPGSHAALWQPFTSHVLDTLAARAERRLVVLLWGKHAQRLGACFIGTQHRVLSTAHPSPLSARNGFFGCGHFAAVNELLVADAQPPIDWRLP